MWWFCLLLVVVYYLVLDRKVWALLRQPLLQSLFLGAVIAAAVLWQLKAQLPDLPAVHFLGMTTITLLLGLRLAVLVIPLALLLPALTGIAFGQPPPAAELLLMQWTVLLLVAIQSYASYMLISLKLPNHLFVSIFVSGFLNSLFAALAYVLWLSVGFFGVLGQGDTQQFSEFLLIMPLLAMPEALLNGMALTLLLVYKPHWVAAFKQI